MPTIRIERIATFLVKERQNNSPRATSSNAVKIKRNLSLKKRLRRDLLTKLNKSEAKRAMYTPWIKFKYSKVIIRSVDDVKFPEVEAVKGKISSWFKGEFSNFYDNGLELLSIGGTMIFDEDGNWDLLKWDADNTSYPTNFTIINHDTFLRIPYDYIVDYDMEPDNYYGYPTIYVNYAKDGMPYEEILYGRMGYYDESDSSQSRLTQYLDKKKRKKLAHDV